MTETPGEKNRFIQVSDLTATLRCPRNLYYRMSEPVVIPPRYHLCRQIASGIPEGLDRDAILDELGIIVPDARADLADLLDEWYPLAENAPFIRPVIQDMVVRSNRLGITGQIDKYDPTAGWSHVRCSTAPKTGCWPDDRIRITALLLCLNEQAGLTLPGGHVEYVPSGVIRYYEPGPRDRRALLHAVKQARRIHDGTFPDKPVDPPCSACRYSDRCVVTAPSLSRLFFKQRE